MAKVTYSKTVPEPERVLRVIGECRATMIQVGSKVRPFGPAWHVLHAVVAAIDALATFMSGERHYFATRLSGAAPGLTAAPGLDLDESPQATPEEFAPFVARAKGEG